MVLFIIIALLSSCKSRTSEFVESLEIDTVYIERETITTPEVIDRFIFQDVCDTLDGEPRIRTITKTIVVGADTLRLWTENNQLQLDVSIKEKQIKKLDSINRVLTQIRSSSKEVVRQQFPWMYVLYGVGILLVLYIIRYIFR